MLISGLALGACANDNGKNGPQFPPYDFGKLPPAKK
jgi:hypothetical protein